jgi:hypothetical protein
MWAVEYGKDNKRTTFIQLFVAKRQKRIGAERKNERNNSSRNI